MLTSSVDNALSKQKMGSLMTVRVFGKNVEMSEKTPRPKCFGYTLSASVLAKLTSSTHPPDTLSDNFSSHPPLPLIVSEG